MADDHFAKCLKPKPAAQAMAKHSASDSDSGSSEGLNGSSFSDMSSQLPLPSKVSPGHGKANGVSRDNAARLRPAHTPKRKASPSLPFEHLLNSSKPKRSPSAGGTSPPRPESNRQHNASPLKTSTPLHKGSPVASRASTPVAIQTSPRPPPAPPAGARRQMNTPTRSFANGQMAGQTTRPAPGIRGSESPIKTVPNWVKESAATFSVKGFPPTFWTGDIHKNMPQKENVTRIDMFNLERQDQASAYVAFCPPPRDPKSIKIITEGLRVLHGTDSTEYRNSYVQFEVMSPKKPFRHQSPTNKDRTYAEEISVQAQQFKFGIMMDPNTFLALQNISPSLDAPPISMKLNLQRKVLDITMPITHVACTTDKKGNKEYHKRTSQFKLRLNMAQMSSIFKVENTKSGQTALIIPMELPSQMFRKTSAESTYEQGSTYWTDWQTWYRQTKIDLEQPRDHATQLQKPTSAIDVGRWLTYTIILDHQTTHSFEYREMESAWIDHNIRITSQIPISIVTGQSSSFWSWLDDPCQAISNGSSNSMDLQQLAQENLQLPFEVRYQLEACISQGRLHECNLDQNFLRTLAKMEAPRATKLLEKLASETQRFYSPHDVFRRLLYKVSVSRKATPSYCAMVRTATVTPTAIYFMAPAMETSNRVIRHYHQHEDRFLRVKFSDEKYRGRVMGGEKTMDEIFHRVYCTMKGGIKVGGRRYEFLAFGNSQFREHGAYFFAPTNSLTTQDIRDWMGDFEQIRIVAKYCSRLGQCFSTTRALRIPVHRESIDDIERNGFCFTDGVGKISPFLAQMIAQEHNQSNSTLEYPSVIQFRLGGCKGVLAVDPSLTKNTVQIRPSQEKFTAMQHRGLEVVRISQFSTAYLNVQLILVLSALGVADEHFVLRMRDMLSDLQDAMTNEQKAMELLSKNIDLNGMTVELNGMLIDGFMQTEDPFTISCLRLWRAWSIKYLKEKARIFVEAGAFVLGCVDETATLKGHSNTAPDSDETRDAESLPEIFLQVPDLETGKWKTVEGVCALARNPSLHPGDIRMVKAVANEKLVHLKNCVVFPQNGDRDLANMCSGGDLDGDDYIVIWDKDLLPTEWNHSPMDYTAPAPKYERNGVSVDAMIKFFVTHMKHDNLGRIAVAHRYWADRQPDGVKDDKCIELAQLHSRAVDYAKTGQPAEMGKHLRVARWPHWAEPKNKPKNKIYKSQKIIGQLYDEVQRVPFEPAWDNRFDKRILTAYGMNDELLQAAQEIKDSYDEAVRRLMAKFGIGSEFEVWSTFVLEHSDDVGDYKFGETFGEAVKAMKDYHIKLCYERAGTTDKERDWSKMGPFIAAMYTITADAVTVANSEFHQARQDEQWLSARSFNSMPFMSFPWLFSNELGRIATKRDDSYETMTDRIMASKVFARKQQQQQQQRQQDPAAHTNFMDGVIELPAPLPDVMIPDKVSNGATLLAQSDATPAPVTNNAHAPQLEEKTQERDVVSGSQHSTASLLDKATIADPLHHPSSSTPSPPPPTARHDTPSNDDLLILEPDQQLGGTQKSKDQGQATQMHAHEHSHKQPQVPAPPNAQAQDMVEPTDDDEAEDEDAPEEVIIAPSSKPSNLDRLHRMMGM